MKITKVVFYENAVKSSNFLSKCSVVLDDCFVLNEIKIFEGKKGKYIIMPTKNRVDKGSFENKSKSSDDVFHPVKKSYFSYMVDVILKGYEIYESTENHIYIP